MVLFAHQDGHPRMIIGEVKLRFSAQTFSQGMHGGPDGLARQTEPLQSPFDPAEKQTSASIRVMVGVMNVAPVCSHPSSKLTDESRTIRADQLQDDRDGGQGRTGITALIVRLDEPAPGLQAKADPGSDLDDWTSRLKSRRFL